MKVLAIPACSGRGGAKLSMVTFLAHRPAGVDAAVLMVTDGPIREDLERLDGVRVHVAGELGDRPRPGDFPRFFRALSRVLAQERPDVVWAKGQKAALLAVAACRARRVPLVWHKVDFSFDGWLAKPLAASVNGGVGVSHAVTEALGPLRSRRVLGAVGLPVSLPDSLSLEPARDPVAIGPWPGSSPARACTTWSARRRSCPTSSRSCASSWRAATAEYPGYRAQLVEQAAAAGLADRLELPGFVTDVESVLDRLTVYVNATYVGEEGFGNEGLSGCVVEAGWAGLPVVSARAGGTAEALVHGVSGTIVEEPTPAALAQAIAPYLRDPAAAQAAGAAGREFARRLATPSIAAERLFEALGRAAHRA